MADFPWAHDWPEITDAQVRAAFARVPRARFVPLAVRHWSDRDAPLPIGEDQTISQPYVVAWMTQALELEPGQRTLEIGTGSGYQAAVLGAFVQHLYTVERIEALYKHTRHLLHDLGYRNIDAKLSDGSWGLKQYAPFDGIIVTAAPEEVPETLPGQLAIGGRLIIPTGPQNKAQKLQVITRTNEHSYLTETHESVQFVPLIRDSNQ